jgi:hypothetical protein
LFIKELLRLYNLNIITLSLFVGSINIILDDIIILFDNYTNHSYNNNYNNNNNNNISNNNNYYNNFNNYRQLYINTINTFTSAMDNIEARLEDSTLDKDNNMFTKCEKPHYFTPLEERAII